MKVLKEPKHQSEKKKKRPNDGNSSWQYLGLIVLSYYLIKTEVEHF
jgi:hypothetical protein